MLSRQRVVKNQSMGLIGWNIEVEDGGIELGGFLNKVTGT